MTGVRRVLFRSGDTTTLVFFKSTSWSRIWLEFLGTSRLLYWDLMFSQADNQLNFADRVGTFCVNRTVGCETLLGYALKFRHCGCMLLKYYWMVIMDSGLLIFKRHRWWKLVFVTEWWFSNNWWLFPTSD